VAKSQSSFLAGDSGDGGRQLQRGGSGSALLTAVGLLLGSIEESAVSVYGFYILRFQLSFHISIGPFTISVEIQLSVSLSLFCGYFVLHIRP
jgi:hypothetical protein